MFLQCLDVWTSGRPDDQMSGRPGVWTSGLDFWTSGRPDVRTSRHSDVWTSGHWDVRMSGRWDIRTSGGLDVRMSGRPDVWTSLRLEVQRTFGHPTEDDRGFRSKFSDLPLLNLRDNGSSKMT